MQRHLCDRILKLIWKSCFFGVPLFIADCLRIDFSRNPQTLRKLYLMLCKKSISYARELSNLAYKTGFNIVLDIVNVMFGDFSKVINLREKETSQEGFSNTRCVWLFRERLISCLFCCSSNLIDLLNYDLKYRKVLNIDCLMCNDDGCSITCFICIIHSLSYWKNTWLSWIYIRGIIGLLSITEMTAIYNHANRVFQK